MRIFILYLTLMVFNAAGQANIVVSGTLREVMQGGDLSAKVAVDTIRLSSATYGLGVASQLKGEIIIIEGKCFRSFIEKGDIVTRQETDTKASMLVRTKNESLIHLLELSAFDSIEDLERKLESKETGISGGRPFAFVIKSRIARVDYHVIDWRGTAEHSPANHKQFARQGVFTNEDVVIVGFYSENHQGIFTPHSTRIHMHVYHPSQRIVGHVDEVMSTTSIKLFLP